MHLESFATPLRHWWATSAEASDHNSWKQTVDANDQEQSFHLGFSSAHGGGVGVGVGVGVGGGVGGGGGGVGGGLELHLA